MSANSQDLHFVVGEEENPARLDKYLAAVLPDISRSRLQQLIRGACIQVGGKTVKPHRRVVAGDTIHVHLPEPVALDIAPENIPLDILYEDSDILVLNKQPGIVVHPAPGHLHSTLVNALLFHTKDLSGINGILRPGIVHRLDKDTSGCLAIAKSDAAHRHLAAQFEGRSLQKEYLAIVAGRMTQSSGTLDMRIGRHPVHRKKMAVRPEGREARTQYERLEEMGGCTLLLLKPMTGRTHQLRVHLAAIGFPILGDIQYARRRRDAAGKVLVGAPRQMLHAYTLGFRHPSTGKLLHFTAPIPPDMQEVLDALRSQ